MRTLTDHIVNPANDKLVISPSEQLTVGGAPKFYDIKTGDHAIDHRITFQDGAINEAGINGLTHEALLAIVADRLRGFQAGPYSCCENALALTKIEEAQMWLQSRTLARMRRGVEGTHKV